MHQGRGRLTADTQSGPMVPLVTTDGAEVERDLTDEQKVRAKHPSKSGHCRRCALAVSDNYGHCPPGFWMNKRESALWDDGVRFSEC